MKIQKAHPLVLWLHQNESEDKARPHPTRRTVQSVIRTLQADLRGQENAKTHWIQQWTNKMMTCHIQQGSQLASSRAVFCTGFHMVTSATHGVHMETTWHPYGNHVVPCGNHIVSTFETMYCPPGNHIVSTWKPNGVHLETTWCAHGNHKISTWQPCSVHRNYMVSMWKPCGVHMETMWF